MDFHQFKWQGKEENVDRKIFLWFADFFQDKIVKIRQSLDGLNLEVDTHRQVNVDTPLNENAVMTKFRLVSEEDVNRIICKLPNKSCSLDVIPTWLLKQCISPIIPPLTAIINLSFTSGEFPVSLKQAIVTPIIKKASLDLNQLKNYRPVFNLKFFSKIMEKCAMSQLHTHMLDNELLDPFQSAYKPQHGTETALLKVKNDILCALDNRKAVFVILLDLSAAFDTVDFDIFDKRLTQCFGIYGNVKSWILSYLKDRKSQVCIAGHKSSEHALTCGVPQGSVVGPGMFTYYTYPLGKIIQSHNLKYHIYADDTQIYIEFDPKIPGDTVIALHKLQECIRELRSWMTVNKLKLNEEKTEFFIAASTHNMNYLNNVSLDVCGTQIKPSNFVRNLGVYFDSNMTMSNHVSSLTRSLNFNLRNIGRIRRYIDEDTCNHTVRTLVLSRLDYANSLLYGITVKDMKKLQTIQNRSARLIFKANRREHTSPLLQQLHWLPVSERIVFKILFLVFKVRMGEAPGYLSDLLSNYVHSDNTRFLRSHADQYLLTYKRTFTSYGDKAFANFVPKLWNKLPVTLRSADKLEKFKSLLKTHLFAH